MEQSHASRYSKEQLLAVAKALLANEVDAPLVDSLFMESWDPRLAAAANGRGWGKASDSKEMAGSYVCWDAMGGQKPISFEDMTPEEKTLFASDVTSPLKPHQPQPKEAANGGAITNGRKSSMSQSNNLHGIPSPISSSRPSTRRRETNDSSPFSAGLASPLGSGRFARDEPSPFFARRSTETKDFMPDKDDSKTGLGFGNLLRGGAPASGLGGGSPWGSPGTLMSPMGTFGSFAMAGSIPPTPIDKKAPFGTARGESRLAHLMPRESSDDAPAKATTWRSRPRTDTDPYGDDVTLGGSAALRGDHDTSDENFGAQGQRSGSTVVHDIRGPNQQTPARRQNGEPLSPSETNPYRSPPDDRDEVADDQRYGITDRQRLHGLDGATDQGIGAFRNLGHGPPIASFEVADRSQTSSDTGTGVGPNAGGLSSLGMSASAGWPSTTKIGGASETQGRAPLSSPFGAAVFSSMAEIQSPSLSTSGSGVFGSAFTNSLGSAPTPRGSKLGSLFPAAMQSHLQQAEQDSSAEGSDARPGLGAIGRGAFNAIRDAEGSARSSRHAFDELLSPTERNQAPMGTGDHQSPFASTSQSLPSQGQSQASNESPNPLPTAQQRMMVMPDRMAWVYLDPQGQVQGPWSGLEMHDWYKASFFTADLSVKKLEDTDFEPLGQLIRRIGNSREPFLVPQIGIPHNFPASQVNATFSATTMSNSAAPLGAVQPPFAGAFPSFGTTLTAEQQNNLERRKQEEQYLMARQREYLAQQQVSMKQMQLSGIPGVLHHHSSAHSLHSQPSYGSMTSPLAMAPQAPLGNVGSFFDNGARTMQQAQVPTSLPPHQQSMAVGSQDAFREDELARLNLEERLLLTNQTIRLPQTGGAAPAQHGAAQSTAFAEPAKDEDPLGFQAKLREFQDLRAQHDRDEEAAGESQNFARPATDGSQQYSKSEDTKPLSLTQQVQQAASAKQSPAASQPESPWAKVTPGLPMPFPPPQSSTPLPAPTAQRGRSNLPETLNAGSRSRSATPETVTAVATLAPWAKESIDNPKGPSLKEIQEAEAQKAARAEEYAAAQRRAAQEQELKMLASQVIAPAPGLPTTSTWATTGSPAATAASAWTKPILTKTQSSSGPSKKTLADIQREEESRKQKAAAATAQTSTSSGGKRYADLASKSASTAAAAVPGPAWSTVGAGGKIKVPAASTAAASQAAVRAVSNPVAAKSTTRPAAVTRTTGNIQSANEEFTKWAKGALAKGLNSDINVDEFLLMLSAFPLEAGIIADSVYANSQLMDGRHFAEEFIRRRKLADKGQVHPAPTSSTGVSASTSERSGGWSEVAKKGPPKEDPTAGFKVVPNKKKGKK